MKLTRVAVAGLLLGAAGLAGCKSASAAFGLEKVTPDEFRVVTKAPLTLPPDYSLRPPQPGEPRPQELQPESAARQAIEGEREGDVRSDGEAVRRQSRGRTRRPAGALRGRRRVRQPRPQGQELRRLRDLLASRRL